jgi:DMSO/TMAO reductase YedYZ heme-binding membrane subunit
VTDELTWYLSRAAGLVAWVLLALALIWGLLLTSRLLDRRPSPAWLLDLHRHLGSLTLLLTVVHVSAIWVDDFVEYTAVEILVPLASDLERLPVALGALALWLLVAVQVTSWQRTRLPLELWRRVHWLSGPLFLLASLHGWLVGTDADHPVAAVIALVLLAEVGLIAGLRLRYGRRPLALQGNEREGAERQPDADELRT